jgi:eukaryotic-like serine/threonine-protein kinase
MKESSLQLHSEAQIGDRYRLEQRIGSGGMATVWLGRDLRLDRPVAIKLLSETLVEQPGFVDRFEREARIAARLSHPNLVTVHDLGFEGDRPYLVMEYVEGETLAERLERDPAGVDATAVGRALLEALAHIHDAGIVHRDIKPANLIFDEAGEVRLTDFGIARMLDGGAQITQTGEVVGTLRYMPPEVADGGAPTARADLFSLGVLLGEIGGHEAGLGTLVERLRDPDPERRPASAAAALELLGDRRDGPSRVVAGRSRPTAASPEPDRRPPRTVTRSRGKVPRVLALSGLAVLAVLVIALAALALSGGEGGGDRGDAAEQAQNEQGAAEEGSAGDGSGEPGGGEALPSPAPDPDPARGARLNDEGFALLNGGEPAEAVPVLERAVASFPEGSDDLEYAYALYNLGRALRLSGRPEAAVPVLERRLQIDNQLPTVRRELRQARSESNG